MLVGWMVIYLLAYPVYSFFLPIYSFWCMDDFSWGNTRLVVGEGSNKKVLVAEDDRFDESMIPLKKFSEYEAEAWETGSHHSDETKHTGYSASHQSKNRSRVNLGGSRPESPRSYNNASHSGDFYRDTNIMSQHNSSNPNLQHLNNKPSMSNMSHRSGAQSQHGGQMMMPQLGTLPFMPFGGPGSVVGGGSEFGGGNFMGGMQQPGMAFPSNNSMYGMGGMGGVPRNSVMTNLNMFNTPATSGSQLGYAGGMMPPQPPMGMGQQRMSTFSLATSVNPFAGPSMNPNPTDDELFNALRMYLSTQDLMSVTKKSTREAVMTKFPKADLSSRKDFLNLSIDKILSES